MTGSSAFKLTDQQIADLRAYIDAGGTLFVNPVGGSREFRTSAQRMLEKLFEGQAVDLKEPGPPADSPLVTGKIGEYRGPAIDTTQLARTKGWQKVAPEVRGLQLRTYEKAGRIVAIFAPYGIHDTLDGHTAFGAMSYLPGPAMDIAANVVLYAAALGGKPAPAASPAPSEAPAKTE
jgi:hypothetical protein